MMSFLSTVCKLLLTAGLIGTAFSQNNTNTKNGGCNQFLDVIFVIDSSMSVRETCPVGGGNQPTFDNWQLVLDFVTQVIQAMPLASNQTRIGVVTFSNKVDEDHVIPLTLYNDSSVLGQRISNLPYIGRNTNMTGALRYANQMLLDGQSSGSSSSVSSRQFVVLLTDGMNNVDGDPIQEARLVKLNGFNIVVVGITDYVDEAGLQEIATPPVASNVFRANDFTHLTLLVGQVLDQLVCNDRPNQPCRDSSIDVVFLLDSSGSIGTFNGSHDLINWNLMTNFVATMIENFRVSSSETRVGLIRFSYAADVIFKLNTFSTAIDAAKAVRQLVYVGSSTNTAGALSVMRTVLFSRQNGARSGVRQVGIVITDGLSDDPPQTAIEAKLAKDAGLEMFAIGLTDLIDPVELQNIASLPLDTHYYNRTTFALVNTVTSQLLWSVCHQVCSSDDNGTQSNPSPSATATGQQQQRCSNATSFCAAGEQVMWTAYPGRVLLGLNYATLNYVGSVAQCQAQCLRDFACRSITYVNILATCSVSYYTKDQAPASSFRADSEAEYFELSCFYINNKI